MLDILKRHLYSKKNIRDVSVLVYNFKCNRCNAKYIGKTKQLYRTQTSEHISVSLIIGKCVKNNSKNVIICMYVIICFFVTQFFLLKICEFLLKVHVILNLGFTKVFWFNYRSQLWTTTSQYHYTCFDNDSRKTYVIIY